MYRDGVAVCDSIRAHDEEREAQKGEVRIDSQSFDPSLTSHPSPLLPQSFEITDWIICAEGDENATDKMILLARLDHTYEVSSTFLFLTCSDGLSGSALDYDACSHPAQKDHKGWIFSESSHDVQRCG
jgi:hypothetical protein